MEWSLTKALQPLVMDHFEVRTVFHSYLTLYDLKRQHISCRILGSILDPVC